MFIKRLHDVASRADNSQIHSDAVRLDGKFFSGCGEFSAKAGSLLRRQHAQQAKIGVIAALFDVNATDKLFIFLVHEKLSGPQILTHSFEVNAIAFDGDAFDNESSVDELLERFGVGDFCDTNWF